MSKRFRLLANERDQSCSHRLWRLRKRQAYRSTTESLELEVAAEKKKEKRTAGSTHIAMDIRHCSKEELDAINERARAWKAQQAKQIAHQPASPKPPEQLELPITGEQTH
jgi:hypothetical protein